jgi:ornithine cyclodeaminase/alanine dehydrogenase
MRDCIEAVESAFRELAEGTADVPTRVSISMKDEEGWLAVMPAHLSRAKALAAKIVTAYTRNQKSHGLPNVLATIILNDVETGSPIAIMEGSHITTMRTGAVSGVATKYLAREDSETLGIIGAGVQARKQLEAINEVRAIRALSIYDTDTQRAQAFMTEASACTGLKAPIVFTCVPGLISCPSKTGVGDVVTVAIMSHDLASSFGLPTSKTFTPTAREVDDNPVSSSKIVVDSIDAALSEAGDLVIPLDRGTIQREDILELGDVITGRKPGGSRRTKRHFSNQLD